MLGLSAATLATGSCESENSVDVERQRRPFMYESIAVDRSLVMFRWLGYGLFDEGTRLFRYTSLGLVHSEEI